MKYNIRQRVFSLGDNFDVKNEFGDSLLTVQGQILSIGDKLRIYDNTGTELFYIEQQLLKLLSEYRIYQGGREVALLKREFSLFTPKINIQSEYGNFRIEGSIFGYSFSVYRDGEMIATVEKAILSFSDTYTLDVFTNDNQQFIVTMVIVIDQMIHDNKNNR